MAVIIDLHQKYMTMAIVFLINSWSVPSSCAKEDPDAPPANHCY